ncbi:phage tail tape measure protein [Photobacterium sp. GSS17]|uniref:phage tail tape measure protein n=1 Tax=Photobacterium sp. GSS17 TaxID=3020715 RepID=UPI00235DF74B|nr:phage tail tape measure protein [Photobacterium sp. GSS17]
MTDYNTELGLSLGPEFESQLQRSIQLMNKFAGQINSIDSEKLLSIGIDNDQMRSLNMFTQRVKHLNKEMQQLTQLVNNRSVRSLQEAVALETYRSNFTGSSRNAHQTAAMYASPAEQRQMRKALTLAIQDALASGNRSMADQLQGFDQKLKKHMTHNERVLGMNAKEREAYNADIAAKKQSVQINRELAQFLGQAKSSNRHSVLPSGTSLGMLPEPERKRALRAQQMYIDNMKLSGVPLDQLRQAEKVMRDLNLQQDALLERRRKETLEIRSRERLDQSIANKDSRALGNAAERYDNLRAGRLGAYSTSRTDAEGLRQLKEQIRLREQNLKLIKAEALQSNLPSHHAKVNAEEKRIHRLKQLEKRLQAAAAAERSYEMAMSPTSLKRRAAISRAQGHETRWGDGGAELFRTQAGLLGNYAVMGAGVGGTYAGIQFTLDLDQSMRQLQAILALTNGELTQMSEHLIDVSEKTKFTALEVMEAATIMGQAGFSPDQINASIEATTYLATAIGSDLQTAVDLQTSVMGVYDKSAGQMMDVSDKIVTAINTSKLNLEKLTLGMQYSGNISSQLGVSFEENMAALGAMANSGIRSGSTLGTGMRQVYTSLQKPSGSFLKWMDSVGLTMEDVSVKTRGLYNVLVTLKEAGFDMDAASRMWETRAASAVGAIFNNMSKFKELMEDFDTSSGAAAAANEKQMMATRNQLERLYSIAGTLFSEAVEPMRLAFTEIVKTTADWLSHLRDAKELIQVMTTLVGGWALGKGVGALFSLLKNLALPGGENGGKGLSAGKQLGSVASMAMRSAGLWGMVGTAAFSAGSYYFNEQRKQNDTMDKAKTELSENLRLYNEQQNAIRKVTQSLYEMGAKQQLFTTDQEALRRYTDNLKSEFGGLGLVLTGVEGDFNKTRDALDVFRAALLEQQNLRFPAQSFDNVLKEQGNQLKAIQQFDAGRSQLDFLGAQEAKVNGSWVSNQSRSATKLGAYLQANAHSPQVQAYQKGVALLTKGASGASPLASLNPQDADAVRSALLTLSDAQTALTFFAKTGITPETGPFKNLHTQLSNAKAYLADMSKTHGEKSSLLTNADLQSFGAKVQNKFGQRGMDLLNNLHRMNQQNPELTRANPKDKNKHASLLLESYTPMLDQLVGLREEMKTFVLDYDKANGTAFGDSMGEFAAWTTLGNEITSLREKINGAQKTRDKFDQQAGKFSNQTIQERIKRLGYMMTHTEDLLEVTRLETEIQELIDKSIGNEMMGKDADSEEYQLELRELQRQAAEQKGLVAERANSQRRKLEAAIRRKQDRAFNTLVTARNMTADSNVELKRTGLRYSLTPEEADKHGQELIDAIIQEGAQNYEQLVKTLDGVSDEMLMLIRAENEKGTQAKIKKAEADIAQKKRQIEAGILRRNESEIRQGLTIDQYLMNQYLTGDRRYMTDVQQNLSKELSLQHSKLTDAGTTAEQFDMAVATIDEVIGRIIQNRSDQIRALEKNPQVEKKRLAELQETERLLRENSDLRISKALRLRDARAASQDDEGTRAWVSDLNHEWSLIRKGLQANTNNRGAGLTRFQNMSEANIDLRNQLTRQLAISGMGTEYYDSVKNGLDGLEAKRMAVLDKGFQTIRTDIERDLASLEEKAADYQSQLNAGGLNDKQTKALETVLANANKEIERLGKEQESLQLRADNTQRESDQFLRDSQGKYLDQTFFDGRYKNKDARNKQAKILGGSIYGDDGTEVDYNKEMDDLEGMARQWQTIKNAASEYGEIMERNYGNYSAMTDAVDKLANATEQAADKAAGLFAEWAMGTKESKDAWAELGQFVLSMLTQIAMQIAVNSAVSGITGLFGGGGGGGKAATGGKVRGKATGGRVFRYGDGGKVPHVGGSRGQDSVPTWLMPDEWVIRSSVARKLGDDTMNAINNGELDPGKLNRPQVNQQVQQGPKELNVWVVQKPEDAGNGGIGPNDVVAIVEDNVMRRGSLRSLIKQVALTN